MSGPWRQVATRGHLDLDVLSPARARQDGLMPLGGDYMLMVLHPDDGDSHQCFSTAPLVRSFIHEMQPRTVRFFVAPGEDEGALQAEIEGKLQ